MTLNKQRGRRGGLEEARELVALVSALRKSGDSLSARVIAERLDCSVEHAKHLLALILELADESGTLRLSAGIDDDFESLVLYFDQVAGKPLRLTHSETIALISALKRTGMKEDSSLALRLRGALTHIPKDDFPDIAEASNISEEVSSVIHSCSEAIVLHKDLEFDYRASYSEQMSHRSVQPLSLHCKDTQWYVDSYDIERAGTRTFRCDLITNLQMVEACKKESNTASQTEKNSNQKISLCFTDTHLLDLFYWPQLTIESKDEEGIHATIDYFGGTWLVRRLTACASGVHINDANMALRVAAQAHDLFGE